MKNGTDRENRDITLGSAPIVEASDTPHDRPYTPLRFDADKFMKFVSDENLTEEQATNLLRACWSIFVAQVDLAFGLSPTSQAVDALASEPSHQRPTRSSVISSTDTVSAKRKRAVVVQQASVGQRRIHETTEE